MAAGSDTSPPCECASPQHLPSLSVTPTPTPTPAVPQLRGGRPVQPPAPRIRAQPPAPRRLAFGGTEANPVFELHPPGSPTARPPGRQRRPQVASGSVPPAPMTGVLDPAAAGPADPDPGPGALPSSSADKSLSILPREPQAGPDLSTPHRGPLLSQGLPYPRPQAVPTFHSPWACVWPSVPTASWRASCHLYP